MRTLLVMRHAKSDWDASYGGDHERPLNQRGLAAARNMGRHLTELDLVPDLILSSTAVRARTTAELAAQAGSWSVEIRLEPRLYAASVDSVLEIISGAGDAGRLMVVGHQPTWAALVTHFTGEPVEMRTATVAVVSLDLDSWGHAPAASGTLTAVHHPQRTE